ncbi:hypothetical protein C487_05809 [Natrinema pallidum DSM 3751]|uniref:Uncharacterized protein n=1 Tax=Natrinema pallidum DSM 3751 TaxID=1227495 RepID=L9Z038_9EURY|nr:hypothetical protein C487_05809 [Natrinema pallidum DSM 3751]
MTARPRFGGSTARVGPLGEQRLRDLSLGRPEGLENVAGEMRTVSATSSPLCSRGQSKKPAL